MQAGIRGTTAYFVVGDTAIVDNKPAILPALVTATFLDELARNVIDCLASTIPVLVLHSLHRRARHIKRDSERADRDREWVGELVRGMMSMRTPFTMPSLHRSNNFTAS